MNTFFILILAAYAIVRGFDFYLDWLNYLHLKKYGHLIPDEFQGKVDDGLLKRTADYTVDKIRFGFIQTVFDEILILVFIFSGLLDWYSAFIGSMKLNFIVSGLVFFLPLIYVKTILDMPFDLYGTFKIEKKYGFNKMSFGLWLSDLVKSLLISTILFSLLISGALALILASPAFWWLLVWALFFLFSIFMMYISPYVIEPLFNKYSPLDDESLSADISSLMSRAGLKISKVQKMDASKRTGHSNAYFTGIGHVKRIVLFDTLIKQMDKSEILAVLAHEAGHWKCKHILKLLFIVETGALLMTYVAFQLLGSDILSRTFMMSGDDFFAKLVLLGFVASTFTYPLAPLFNIISRKFEWQADKFACGLTGENKGLASALVKLTQENLSNLHPHPLYAKFHYSHPPVVERLKYLRKFKD
ncbi:MAG TPA: peptidase M48 [Lentisphaeria bacterium]|nr:MAG: peptidase M48 [Lentisphaerae bacterium GWF2_50_93]HCE44989.1 peptidase M48 [Lentisphaeria bacterium]